MAVIACDTDFLIKIANDPLPKFDWATLSRQNDFCTLPCVVRELSNLRYSKLRLTSRRAVMALNVVGERAKIVVIKTPSSKKPHWSEEDADADDALIEFVEEDPQRRLVATLDGDLLSALESKRMPYLTLSSGRPLIASRRAMHLSKTRRVNS